MPAITRVMILKKKIRTYSELACLPDFRSRYEYLKLGGNVGETTFGFDRWINQRFYKSDLWRRIRDEVIVRDKACDLAMPGYEISKRILIHHMNPLSEDDIRNMTDYLLNPDYLVCVSHKTHNAIHYGTDYELLIGIDMQERRPNDTIPWRA